MKKRDFVKQLSVTSLSLTIVPSFTFSACNTPPSGKAASTNGDNIDKVLLPLELPSLPYGYADLEPVIDATTMELHHAKHHQGYVNKLKPALGNETAIDARKLFSEEPLSDEVRNFGGGHFNHSLFWEGLTPGGSNPSKAFLKQIKRYFGSLSGLKTALIEGGKSVFGSGWVWLIKDSAGDLKITTTPNQDNPLMKFATMTGVPLLGIDVWEHAYYLKYQNLRGEYLTNILNILNWEVIEKRFKS